MDRKPITGRGTHDEPISRSGSCAYAGCTNDAVMTRITSDAHFVVYCRAHEREAARVFDQEHELDA